MRNILKYGIVSFAMAFGMILLNADSASAQNRRYANREYRQDTSRSSTRLQQAGPEWQLSQGEQGIPRGYEGRTARVYSRTYGGDRNGWFWYSNGRRMSRPFSTWNYTNGYFIRRY